MRDFWELLGFDSNLYDVIDPNRISVWPDYMRPYFTLSTTEGVQFVFMGALGAVIAAFVVYALWRTFKMRDAIPWLFLLGGLLSSFCEGIFDQVDYLAMTAENTFPAWVLFGCAQPVFIPLFYMVILGIAPYFVFRSLQSGRLRSRRQLVILHVLFTICEFSGEIIAIKAGIFQYSGLQPFSIIPGAPLWIAVVNSTMILGGPVVVWKLHENAGKGAFSWRYLDIPFLMVGAMLIVAFGCTWPIQVAFSWGYPAGFDPTVPITVCALVSMTLSVILYSYLMKFVTGAGYFDPKDAETRTDEPPAPLLPSLRKKPQAD